jgi:phage repressor protein C with HTH and peptisase S24 domain
LGEHLVCNQEVRGSTPLSSTIRIQMNWKDIVIEKLRSGEQVTIKGCGNSMTPRFKNGDRIILDPVNRPLKVGDAVFVKVGKNTFTHLITAIRGEQYQISNNHGHVNGWVTKESIYGIAVGIKRKGKAQ